MVEQVKNISDQKKKEYAFYTYVNLELFVLTTVVIAITGVLFSGMDNRNNDQAHGWSPLIQVQMGQRTKHVFPRVHQSHILPGL